MLTAIRSGKILLPERIDFMELKDTIELQVKEETQDKKKIKVTIDFDEHIYSGLLEEMT